MENLTVTFTEDEKNFLMNLMLQEIKKASELKRYYGIESRKDPKAKYIKESFFEIDEFVRSIYKKLCV